MIALIDYGAGNLTSVRKALAAVGADVYTPQLPSELGKAHGVIVPGVGNFQRTCALDRPWREAIGSVVHSGRPLLGICLGLQWLFEGSTEAPDAAGLAWMAGRCDRLEASRPLKVPHVGWNSLQFARPSPLFAGIADGSQVYFTHSFAAPVTDAAIAITRHGVPFASAVARDHVFGVQFHPEKSGEIGLQLLKNFVNAL